MEPVETAVEVAALAAVVVAVGAETAVGSEAVEVEAEADSCSMLEASNGGLDHRSSP